MREAVGAVKAVWWRGRSPRRRSGVGEGVGNGDQGGTLMFMGESST